MSGGELSLRCYAKTSLTRMADHQGVQARLRSPDDLSDSEPLDVTTYRLHLQECHLWQTWRKTRGDQQQEPRGRSDVPTPVTEKNSKKGKSCHRLG